MAENQKTCFKRPLDITEDLSTSISFYSDLECENLTKDMICHALSLLRQHHPYFRLRAEKIDDKIWLVEDENGNIPVIWLEGITKNWEDELNSFANQAQDHTVSLTFLQCRYDNKGRYQLFGVVNHIALDGIGFVKALHTFYSYLGDISVCANYKTVPLADRRPFVDVFTRNPITELPVFNFNNDYLLPQELDSEDNDIRSFISSTKGQMIGLFKKFDRETTTKLLVYTKTHSTSPQGILSIAALITSIWIRKVRPQLPIWTLNWCATNLRQSAQPPIDPEDCVLASAPLAWEQYVDKDLSIWNLAQEASKQLHEHNNQHMGWHLLNATKFNVPIKPPSVMTSSNGRLQLGTEYKRLKVKDLRIMNAHYDDVSIDASSHMNYVGIYDGQLHLVTTFTYPGLSKQWGTRFHNGITYILESLANNSNLTVRSIFETLDKQDKVTRFCPIQSSLATYSTITSRIRSIVSLGYRKYIRQLHSIAGLSVSSCCVILFSLFLYIIRPIKFGSV